MWTPNRFCQSISISFGVTFNKSTLKYIHFSLARPPLYVFFKFIGCREIARSRPNQALNPSIQRSRSLHPHQSDYSNIAFPIHGTILAFAHSLPPRKIAAWANDSVPARSMSIKARSCSCWVMTLYRFLLLCFRDSRWSGHNFIVTHFFFFFLNRGKLKKNRNKVKDPPQSLEANSAYGYSLILL